MGILLAVFVVACLICAVIGHAAYYSDEEVNARKQNAQRQKDLMDYEDQKSFEEHIRKVNSRKAVIQMYGKDALK